MSYNVKDMIEAFRKGKDKIDLLKVLEENKWDLELCRSAGDWMVYCPIAQDWISTGKTPTEAIRNAIEQKVAE